MGNIVRVEKILSDTFCKIDAVKGQNPIWFHYGDSKELDSVLTQKREQRKYPLLWYVMPNKMKYSLGTATGKITLILAHNTDLDWNNDQRFEKVFDEILFPYLENIVYVMSRSANISFSLQREYSFTNFPNYSVVSENKTQQIDAWDAIKLEFENLTIKEDYKC